MFTGVSDACGPVPPTRKKNLDSPWVDTSQELDWSLEQARSLYELMVLDLKTYQNQSHRPPCQISCKKWVRHDHHRDTSGTPWRPRCCAQRPLLTRACKSSTPERGCRSRAGGVGVRWRAIWKVGHMEGGGLTNPQQLPGA